MPKSIDNREILKKKKKDIQRTILSLVDKRKCFFLMQIEVKYCCRNSKKNLHFEPFYSFFSFYTHHPKKVETDDSIKPLTSNLQVKPIKL